MNSVGPSTPAGTLCLYIGPDQHSFVGRLLCASGEQVRIATTSMPDPEVVRFLQQATGFYPECGVQTVAHGCHVPALFKHLIRIDGDDPDAGERITDDQPTEITA